MENIEIIQDACKPNISNELVQLHNTSVCNYNQVNKATQECLSNETFCDKPACSTAHLKHTVDKKYRFENDVSCITRESRSDILLSRKKQSQSINSSGAISSNSSHDVGYRRKDVYIKESCRSYSRNRQLRYDNVKNCSHPEVLSTNDVKDDYYYDRHRSRHTPKGSQYNYTLNQLKENELLDRSQTSQNKNEVSSSRSNRENYRTRRRYHDHGTDHYNYSVDNRRGETSSYISRRFGDDIQGNSDYIVAQSNERVSSRIKRHRCPSLTGKEPGEVSSSVEDDLIESPLILDSKIQHETQISDEKMKYYSDHLLWNNGFSSEMSQNQEIHKKRNVSELCSKTDFLLLEDSNPMTHDTYLLTPEDHDIKDPGRTDSPPNIIHASQYKNDCLVIRGDEPFSSPVVQSSVIDSVESFETPGSVITEIEDAQSLQVKDELLNLQHSDKNISGSLNALCSLNDWCPLLDGCRKVDVYQRLNKISEGTYGAVYRARNKLTNSVVALKHIKYHEKVWEEGFPITSLREISILLELHHPNIVHVEEVVVGANPNQIFMAMEYVEHELKVLLEEDRPPFCLSEKKTLLLQLLSAIDYIHSRWIIHRDLKTSNLLYTNSGILKICDFGMSRKFGHPIKPYTHNVVTLWYRAPELLLGQTHYTTAVDIWSVGCIMAELLLRRPIFKSKNETETLDQIFRLCGTPMESTWPGYKELPIVSQQHIEFTRHSPTWRAVFPVAKSHITESGALSDTGLHLLKSLLTLDPSQRITAKEALLHPFFSEKPLPQRAHLMPTAPDSNMTARLPHRPEDSLNEIDIKNKNMFHDAQSRYTFGSRVDPQRYLTQLESSNHKKNLQNISK